MSMKLNLHDLLDDVEASGELENLTLSEFYRQLLLEVGEDPDRDGLRRTPERAAKALAELTKGYRMDARQVLNGALFEVSYDEMVIVKDIEMFSLCEHHLLPFFGKVHVAYIPRNKVIGLSKVARVVEMFGPPAASPGEAHQADRRHDPGGDRTGGRRGRDRSAASLHDDARYRETALVRGDQRHGGGVPRQPADAGRVPLADSAADRRGVSQPP